MAEERRLTSIAGQGGAIHLMQMMQMFGFGKRGALPLPIGERAGVRGSQKFTERSKPLTLTLSLRERELSGDQLKHGDTRHANSGAR
jgi:hypothetical protein